MKLFTLREIFKSTFILLQEQSYLHYCINVFESRKVK